MLNKIPFIASRQGGAPEFVEDNVSGFLADPFNVEDIVDKAVKILQGGEEISAIVNRAYKIVKNRFTIEHFIDRFEQHLNSLLDGRPRVLSKVDMKN